MNRQGTWANAGIGIVGLGHYYPRNLVRNPADPQPAADNVVDRALIGRVQVTSRHIADETETVGYMAAQASRAALRAAGRDPGEVDLLVLSNWTERQYIPEIAPQVATAIGARRALAFDVCAACAGFVHAVQTAAALLVATPAWRCAVVVSSDQFSRRVRPHSRGELITSDAAGAVVLARQPGAEGGLIDSLLLSDGDAADLIKVKMPEVWVKSQPELLDSACRATIQVAETLLERNEMKIADVNWMVPHPGSEPIHSRIRARLGIEPERFVMNFQTRGNASSASIPIVLSEFFASGRFRRGDVFLATAVGSGWYCGGLLFEL